MSCRFSAPVYPGETIVTEIWKLGDGRATFQSRIAERNILVLAHGLADYTQTTTRLNPDRTPATTGGPNDRGAWRRLCPRAPHREREPPPLRQARTTPRRK